MIYVKVTFDDGNSLITGFNGTIEEAKGYYVSQLFEMNECEPMVQGISVELIP